MAEAKQVEAGLVGPTPSDDPVEPASVATLPAPSASEPTVAERPEPAAGADDASSGADSEPSASVRGVPTWTFAVPPSGPPRAPGAILSPAAASAAAPAGFPPPPPAPPAPGAPRPGATPGVQLLTVPSLGPAGEPRHPAAVTALSVVTLGAYAVAWHAQVNREMSDFDARLEVRPGASTLPVGLAWTIGLLCTLAGAAAIIAHALRVGPHLFPFAAGPTLLGVTVPWAYLMLLGLLAVPYLVLLLPTSSVALVMTLERVRLVQERVGIRPDRQLHPVRRAALLLLPVVGGLWHLASVQSSLNAAWRAAPPPLPRRQ
ncbi:MAG: hypothetical protein ABR977_06235 [Candidatus Dormibacteria bacterium]|jgi:hypothetical protein